MKYFSKRWFSNLLIILFGIVILLIAGLVSYKTFFMSADSIIGTLPFYDISGDYLRVYYPNAITNAFSSVSGTQPADPFAKISYYNDPTRGSTRFAYTPIKNNTYITGWSSLDDPSYKLMAFAFEKAKDSNDKVALPIINTAMYNYRQAVLYSGTNYRIVDDTLFVHNGFEQTYTNSLENKSTGDEDVSPSGSFPFSNFAGANSWSLSLPIKSDTKYKNPLDQSLAMTILNSALESAMSAESQENALLKEKDAPSNISKTWFSQDKGMIQTAIDNYKKQISSNTSSDGLTISSVDTVDFNGSLTMSFTADYRKIVSGSSNIQKFTLGVNSSFITSFDPTVNISQTGTNQLTWNSSQKKGSYVLDANSGDPASKVSTAFPGAKVFQLSAVDQNGKVIAKADKTVTVLPGTGTSVTPGGGVVPVSLTVPQSVDLSNQSAAQNVEIKISASNLRGTPPVGKISWWICPGTQEQRTDPKDYSNGCSEKDSFGPFPTQDSFTDKIGKWDASKSAPGTYVAMAKVFALSDATPGIYPDYPGSTKVVSSNISVVKDMTGVVGGGGSGGGVNDNAPKGKILPDWAANFQQSKTIKTIQDLFSRVGSFTLLILAILAVLAIIIAGMKYITSGGDPKGAESGKKAILYAVYGIAIAVLSISLVQITISEVKKIVGDRLPSPNQPGNLIPQGGGFGGTNASVLDIIGHQSGFIWRVIQLAVYYAEAVAFFYILYASFIYITSFGDDAKAESGKKTLLWAVIGLAIVISANFLINTFGKLVA